eukprot:Em0024g377a
MRWCGIQFLPQSQLVVEPFGRHLEILATRDTWTSCWEDVGVATLVIIHLWESIRMASHPQPESCLYICGTDEYGTATETKALEEGHSPQEICAKYFQVATRRYTTVFLQRQKMSVIYMYLGYFQQAIPEGTCVQGLDGTTQVSTLQQDARGDQCDKCGNLINAIKLKSPRCKICSNQPKVESSNHLFLDFAMVSPSWRVVWELAEVTSSPAVVLISGSVVLEVIIRGSTCGILIVAYLVIADEHSNIDVFNHRSI